MKKVTFRRWTAVVGQLPHRAVNAAAWALGILWTIAPSPLVDEHTPLGAIFTVYVAAGLLMALTVAIATGFAARRVAHEHLAQKNSLLRVGMMGMIDGELPQPK